MSLRHIQGVNTEGVWDFVKVKGTKLFNNYKTVPPLDDNVKRLYQNGANVNARNKYDKTPILLAALNAYRSVVK